MPIAHLSGHFAKVLDSRSRGNDRNNLPAEQPQPDWLVASASKFTSRLAIRVSRPAAPAPIVDWLRSAVEIMVSSASSMTAAGMALGSSPPGQRTLPTAQDSALTVRQGRADALINSTPGAVELMDRLPSVYAVAGGEFESTTRIGMAVRKGDAVMKAALEAALKDIVADGSYKKLIETWKFPSSVSLFD